MTKKRRKALFSWLGGDAERPDLSADRKAPWLDVAEFPGEQQAQEQKHRQADPNGERARHAAALGAAVPAVFQHEEQRKSEAREDPHEGQRNDIFHDSHYRPPSAAQALTSNRRRGRFWFITAAAILTIGVTASLGKWQLSRAAQKEALQASIDAQSQRPAIDQSAFLAAQKMPDTLNRAVHLRGLWLAPQTVYLDNRQMRGVPGFYVLTPLALEGSDQTVMVQRGWIQRNFENRTQLQPVQTPSGLVEVDARIVPPPSHLLELGKSKPTNEVAGGEGKTPTEGSSLIRQNLDLEAFRAETGLPLRTDVSLQQTGGPSEGLQRDWPAPALGVERHYGYAFQWFGLAVLVAFLYVWFQLIAPRRKSLRASGEHHG